MAKGSNVEFVCDNCGITQQKWMGKCPNCGKFNTLIEHIKQVKVAAKPKSAKHAARAAMVPTTEVRAIPLNEIRTEDFQKIQLHSNELNNVLGGGLTPGSVVLLGGAPGSGKCLKSDTLVYTEDGMVEIGSLLNSDAESGKFHPLKKNILSSDGVRLSENVFKSNLEPMINLVTKNGYSISTTEDHALLTLSRQGQYEWKKSKDITTDDYVALQRDQSLFGNQTEFPEFEYEKHTNAINPIFPTHIDVKLAYILGCLIGDGSLGYDGYIQLTTPDESIKDAFVVWITSLGLNCSSKYIEKKHCYDCRCSSVALVKWLNFMPMTTSYHKFIPTFILKAPHHIIKSFLQGLFDTDGTVDKAGYVAYSSVSHDLLKKLQLLILQFGIVSRLRKKKTNQGLGYAYNLDIYSENALIFNQRIGFTLDRQIEKTKKLRTNFNTNIDTIPYLPQVDISQLSGSRGKAGLNRRLLRRYLSGERKASYTSLQKYLNTYPEFMQIYCDHFYWDQIKVKESAPSEICYDLNVPTNSTFIANGIVSHNSTLLSAVSGFLAKEENVLYASAEEAPQQIKGRMDRMGINSDKLFLMTETKLENILEKADILDPIILVIDSIQTIYTELSDSSAGTITQVRECASILTNFAKSYGITVFIVSQMTKSDDFAGPRILEHIVDTTLYLEGDENGAFRILRSIKNRFGPSPETGFFKMESSGFTDVPNPSDILLSERNSSAAGTTIASMIDGSKAMLVEVQALASDSEYANPSRSAMGFDRNRVSKLADVLTKHAKNAMSIRNIMVNIVGGIEGNEPAIDVPMAIAMLSSLHGKIIPGDTISFGEIGLTGEIRSVSRSDLRLKEAKKIGMKRVIMPGSKRIDNDIEGLEIIYMRNVGELAAWVDTLPSDGSVNDKKKVNIEKSVYPAAISGSISSKSSDYTFRASKVEVAPDLSSPASSPASSPISSPVSSPVMTPVTSPISVTASSSASALPMSPSSEKTVKEPELLRYLETIVVP